MESGLAKTSKRRNVRPTRKHAKSSSADPRKPLWSHDTIAGLSLENDKVWRHHVALTEQMARRWFAFFSNAHRLSPPRRQLAMAAANICHAVALMLEADDADGLKKITTAAMTALARGPKNAGDYGTVIDGKIFADGLPSECDLTNAINLGPLYRPTKSEHVEILQNTMAWVLETTAAEATEDRARRITETFVASTYDSPWSPWYYELERGHAEQHRQAVCTAFRKRLTQAMTKRQKTEDLADALIKEGFRKIGLSAKQADNVFSFHDKRDKRRKS